MAEDLDREKNAYDNAYSKEMPPAPEQRVDAEVGTSQVYVGQDVHPQSYSASYAVPQKRQGKGWIVGIVVIVAICICTLFGIGSCNATMAGIADKFGSTPSTDWSTHGADSIAVIDIDGTIQYDGSACSPEGLKKLLDKASSDDNIKGVVLNVDSGGGVATAGEEMSGYVWDFDKPIVVASASTNASAAYEISSQADYIFTNKTTSIGAIGVALKVTDLSGLYEKLGISIENITSKDSKDASYGDRPLTEEEKAWYQHMVDQIDEEFVATVARGRGMEISEVEPLANGLPYTGIDAVECGLADEIGTLDDAIAYASELAGFSRALPTVDYSYSGSDLGSLLDLLGSESLDGSSSTKAISILKEKYGFE